MPQENHQKIKLLKIMEILRQETDEDHAMTKADLCARLVSMANMGHPGIPSDIRVRISGRQRANRPR